METRYVHNEEVKKTNIENVEWFQSKDEYGDQYWNVDSLEDIEAELP